LKGEDHLRLGAPSKKNGRSPRKERIATKKELSPIIGNTLGGVAAVQTPEVVVPERRDRNDL